MQTTTSAPTVPVTLPVDAWRSCADALVWADGLDPTIVHAIYGACDGMDIDDLVTMHLPERDALALRGVYAFSADDPEPEPTPEPRQVVTPAGTTYLLPGFEPAPREKGGAMQTALF